MARRHYINVRDEKLSGNPIYRLDILDSNFSGSDTEILCADPRPMTIEQKYFETDGFVWAFSKQIKLNIPVKDSTDEAQYDYLFKSFYKDVECQLFVFGTLKFKGWLKPKSSIKDYIEYPKRITCVFTDGLSEATEERIVDDQGGDIAEASRISPLDVIVASLDKIGLKLPINIQFNTYENTYMTSTEQSFEHIGVANIRYQRESQGENGWVTVFEALETTLSILNSSLRQSDGFWWVQSNTEVNTPFHKYDEDGTYLSRDTITSTSKSIDPLCAVGNGNIRFEEPIGTLRVTTRNRSFFGPANANPEFTSGGASWNLSADWSEGSGFSLGFAYLYEDDGHSSTDTYTLTSDVFTVNGTGSDVNLIFFLRHNLTYLLGGNNMEPFLVVEFRVNAGSWIFAGQLDLLTVSEDVWYDYRWEITQTLAIGLQNMEIRLRYYDIGNPANQQWDNMNAIVDYFYLVPNYSDQVAYDFVEEWQQLNDKPPTIKRIENFFNDESPLNTIASYTVKGNDGPFQFNRVGKTDLLPMRSIVAQEIMNNYRGWSDLVSINLDRREYFDTHFTLSHNSKEYRILSYSLDPFNGFCNMLLREIDTSGTDEPLQLKIIPLTSIDGYLYRF